MPIHRLRDEIVFPDPARAEWPGIVAVGGDLSAARLLAAYSAGIFPWYERGQPILWWSPDPRLALVPECCHVPRSLRKTIRAGRFEVRLDTEFERVIRRCAEVPRPGQEGTWITEEMILAYVELHRLGFAHSTEAWEGPELAGGLYGVALGAAYFGESMFADRPDASKVAFVALVEKLRAWSFELIDCQMTTPHLLRFGAIEIPRHEFLERLRRALCKPTRRGSWSGSGAGA
ncbi:MAG: leucyl/phenylalanyl-tRNA--protein transferase [Deltaproteobacteria bacterium]|nr:leucyl/phenylalanyl-tRNA--protein transferase [Deltaproteobacteria bacterium]